MKRFKPPKGDLICTEVIIKRNGTTLELRSYAKGSKGVTRRCVIRDESGEWSTTPKKGTFYMYCINQEELFDTNE